MHVLRELWLSIVLVIGITMLFVAGAWNNRLLVLNATVRQQAMSAVNQLWNEGYWVSNIHLDAIETRTDTTCFTFRHEYKNRTRTEEPEIITICK